MTRVRAKRLRQSGGAAVEFALVMPIFIGVLFGMIDYGWYFYQKFTLAAAIREGVRLGATYRYAPAATPPSDPAGQAVTEAGARCDQGSVPSAMVNFTSGYLDAAPTMKLWVQGEYTFHPLVGLVPLPNSDMKYKVTMLLEQQY
jgi:Flp pilus assembly protein TadG